MSIIMCAIQRWASQVHFWLESSQVESQVTWLDLTWKFFKRKTTWLDLTWKFKKKERLDLTWLDASQKMTWLDSNFYIWSSHKSSPKVYIYTGVLCTSVLISKLKSIEKF